MEFSEVSAPDDDFAEGADDAHALARRATAYREEQARNGVQISTSEAVKAVSKKKG